MNGKDWNSVFLPYREVKNGGTIEFVMGPEPNKSWGTDSKAPAEAPVSSAADAQFYFNTPDGKVEIALNTADVPDLTDWAHSTLAPTLTDWYPKIVSQLAGTSYVAPAKLSITTKPMPGVAATSGTDIVASADWMRNQREGEATGSLIHEMVHVVQQYGQNPENPGWLVEGIADYIRWFRFEPQSHGADNVWLRNQGAHMPHYNDGYRATANFLDWASAKYAPNLVHELNLAMHNGTYRPDLWKQLTTHSLEELGDEWCRAIETLPLSASAK